MGLHQLIHLLRGLLALLQGDIEAGRPAAEEAGSLAAGVAEVGRHRTGPTDGARQAGARPQGRSPQADWRGLLLVSPILLLITFRR